MNREKLDKLKAYSLSGTDMIKLTRGQAKILTYPELVKYDNIDDVLGLGEACIILYETRQNYGHWCCIFKRDDGDNVIEFWDSYGTFIDDELKYVPEVFRVKNNMLLPHMCALLYYSDPKYKIEYNEFPMQQKKKGVNTCGRWAGARVLNRHMKLEDFVNKFKNSKSGLNPDDLITLYTQNLF